MRLRSAPGPLFLALGLAAAVPISAVAAAQAHPARSAVRTAVRSVARQARTASPAAALPGQVYAPYFETWTRTTIDGLARRSGVRYFTLAFLQTPRRGSCTLAWNGDRSQPVRPGGAFSKQIAALRALGGDVIISFGGFSADHGGTEIADSCHSVARITQAYQKVITSYGVTRLDMDVEDRSLDNSASMARRSAAIARLEAWARRTHRRVQVDLTVGAVQSGFPASSRRVIASAIAHRAAITVVNGMTFDYFAGKKRIHMGDAAVSGLRGMHRQLGKLYPGRSSARLWSMLGVTLLPGIDDNPLKNEITYRADVRKVAAFARAHRLPLVTIWAIQRDNGGCPGTVDSDTCSGLRQTPFEFSALLAR
jgi:hypothetical protein